jgi:hypothetical protein
MVPRENASLCPDQQNMRMTLNPLSSPKGYLIDTYWFQHLIEELIRQAYS